MKRRVRGNRRGVLLIVVLVLVLLMGVAAYGFLLAMQTENIAARSSGDRLTAQQSAFSGMELLAAVLEMPRTRRQEWGGVASNPDRFHRIPLGNDVGAADDAVPRFTVAVPGLPPPDRTDVPGGAEDESAKLHLGKLVEWDALLPDSGRQSLLRLPGMTPDIADAILDWVDTDSQPRFHGAESDAYAGQGTPIRPRNGVPLDLEELLLVRGITPALLFGGLIARPEEVPGDGPSHSWSRYLTVYSAERNEAGDGAPRVFLNQPQLDVLHRQLAERMPIAWANFIVLYRQYGAGGTSEEVAAAEQITMDFTRPPVRPILSPLDLIDAVVAVPRDRKSVGVASPFSSESLVMTSQLPLLLDQVSVAANPVIQGRININAAPREVLLAIPGVDEGLAERILASRSMGSENSGNRGHACWLLTEGLVDLATMRKLLPCINAGGDVFRGAFTGSCGPDAPEYRCEAVIDASGTVARQIYFREIFGEVP